MDRFLKTLLVLLFFVFGLYVGIAGWMASDVSTSSNPKIVITGPVTVDGITFGDPQAAERYLREAEVDRWFPWMRNPLPPRIFACIGFALVGGAIAGLKRLLTGTSPDFLNIFLQWLVAGALGLILYFLISVVSSGQSAFFILMCLIGGLFSDEAYGWLETKVKPTLDRIFAKSN